MIANELCVAQPLVEQEFRKRESIFFSVEITREAFWSLMDVVS